MLYEHFLLSQPPPGSQLPLAETMQAACDARDIPSAVLAASGPRNFRYARAFGSPRSISQAQEERLDVDAVFWMAGCTELMTTVAALQCVERGFLSLDGDVTDILSELRDAHVLSGYDADEKPILAQNIHPITLRHLLTHTSGLEAPAVSQIPQRRQRRISASTSTPPPSHPPHLHSLPGTSFSPNPALPWIHLAITRATGLSLSAFLHTHIWTPLAMHSATLSLSTRPDLHPRLAPTSRREGLVHPVFGTSLTPDGDIVQATSAEAEEIHAEEEDDASCYTSATDWARLLTSLCLDDGMLLCTALAAELWQPQLGPEARQTLRESQRTKELNASLGGPGELELDFGLGGMLVVDTGGESVTADGGGAGGPRRLQRGTMFGGGVANVYWWMSRAEGVSGVWATQLVPRGDVKCLRLVGRFEEEMRGVARGWEVHCQGVKGYL